MSPEIGAILKQKKKNVKKLEREIAKNTLNLYERALSLQESGENNETNQPTTSSEQSEEITEFLHEDNKNHQDNEVRDSINNSVSNGNSKLDNVSDSNHEPKNLNEENIPMEVE